MRLSWPPVAAALVTAMAVSAAPEAQQVPFQQSAGSTLPPLPSFPGHTLIKLNDGNIVPSPAFGVGTAWYQNDGNATVQAVLSALKLGYRHLDNAAIYGNERAVGQAIEMSGIPRGELYITTKYDHMNGDSVEEEFEKSLKKLGVKYIDLYLIHFPKFADKSTWPALQRLKSLDLVRSIGISNYYPEELVPLLADSTTKIVPAVNQIRYHPYNLMYNQGIVDLAKEQNIVLAAYSSLTSLTKDKGGLADAPIQAIAKARGWSEGAVLLNWVKSQGILSVTTSGNPEHQADLLAVFSDDFPALTAAEIKSIEVAGKAQERLNQ